MSNGRQVLSMVREALPRLTAAETKVARRLLTGQVSVGLGSSSQLASAAHVSAPTVSRFVQRLGYLEWAAFQQALKDDVDARVQSPTSVWNSPGERSVRLAEAVESSITHVPEAELDRAAGLLADPARPVNALGGLHSHICARHLVGCLRQVRRSVRYVDGSPRDVTDLVADVGRRDVVVLFDYRRYELPMVELAERLSTCGAAVVLFTDVALSPVADFADAVVSAEVSAGLVLDSLTPALGQVELVVQRVVEKLGESAVTRLEQWTSASNVTTRRWAGLEDAIAWTDDTSHEEAP